MDGEGEDFVAEALGDGEFGFAEAEALVQGLLVDGRGVEDGGLDALLAEGGLHGVAGFAAGGDADGVLVPDVACGRRRCARA